MLNKRAFSVFFFKIGQKMCSPFVKFLNHTCSYMVFLVFMFMGSLRKGSGNPLMDIACHGFEETLPDSIVFLLILIWVLGKSESHIVM